MPRSLHRFHLAVCAAAVVLAAHGSVSEAPLAQEAIKPPGRRIIGGEKTDISQHLWQVALQIRGHFGCGGSIIAQKWVLTAAHCFKHSAKSTDWKSKAGVTNHATTGIWAEIDRIVIHEAYNPVTYENDIALIKLKVPPNGRVIPLLAATVIVPIGQQLEVTGWGVTEAGATSQELLKATVPHVEAAVCNGSDSYNGRIHSGMMCAGHREGGIDSCQGDSGGPLVWRTPDGAVLVGVVSWGDGCALQLKYGVYTRVSAYRTWIDGIMAADRN